jgi:hypothetical protein
MDTKTLTFHHTPHYYYIGSGSRYPIMRAFKGLNSVIYVCHTEEDAISYVADCTELAHHETETTECNLTVSHKKKKSK